MNATPIFLRPALPPAIDPASLGMKLDAKARGESAIFGLREWALLARLVRAIYPADRQAPAELPEEPA